MDEKGMSMSDFLTLEKLGNRNKGVANTALGLGIAGLAIAAVGTAAVGFGVNAISKARSRGAEKVADAHALALQQAISNGQEANRTLATLIATERSSREAWQAANQPTIGQYVQVQTNPNLSALLQDYVSSNSSANATAQAIATAMNNGINSAVAHDSALKVSLYGAPQPCNCPGCNG